MCNLLLPRCAGEAHAEELLDSDAGCPLCHAPVTNATLKVVPLEPHADVVKARARLRGVQPCSFALPRRA